MTQRKIHKLARLIAVAQVLERQVRQKVTALFDTKASMETELESFRQSDGDLRFLAIGSSRRLELQVKIRKQITALDVELTNAAQEAEIARAKTDRLKRNHRTALDAELRKREEQDIGELVSTHCKPCCSDEYGLMRHTV